MTTFLDTNIVIALLSTSDPHHAWSVSELIKRKMDGPAIISDIVYCEVSMGMKSQDEVDAAIELLGLERTGNSDSALVRAGEAFLQYRKTNKGPKLGVLPDFLIGAVADDKKAALMTVNPRDYVNYFPTVKLIEP